MLSVVEVPTARADGARDLEALYRDHHVALSRLAMVLVGDPGLADDLAQEAFVRLGRSWRWPAPGAELAYLRRIVINLAHGHHRKLAVARRHDRADDRVGADAADAVEHDERRREVLAAVRALPDRQRDCTVLRFYAELSDAEIAATLGISAGSVKTHLHRARSALAARLGDLR
jgi:RNA polymerase sigma factor (sigma-70 family)